MMTELTTSGCNAHIVRLPQNQLLTYFDPRGAILLTAWYSAKRTMCALHPC